MNTIEARVADYCRRHDLLPPREPILALVSGGADSMCLLDVLLTIHDGPVGVLSVDHGLRATAAGEVDAVLAYASARGCAVHREALNLTNGSALQARAREARLACAQRIAERHRYARIATGHTLSDQAETVLFRLARGSGRDGLSGIAPRRGLFVRPLLELMRTETRAWCRSRGLAFVDDPSNRDERFGRVRIRRDLLPALERIHSGAQRNVAAAADLLRDENELLTPLIDAGWSRCARAGGLDADALANESPALARLVVRRFLRAAGLPAQACERAHLARILDVANAGGSITLPGAMRLARVGGLVRVSGPAAPYTPPAPQRLPVPGEIRCGPYVVRAARAAAEPPQSDRVAVNAAGPLQVRAAQPGDRLALAGGGRRLVGRLLADRGVPVDERARTAVVTQGERLVWVVGHRAAADLLAPLASPAVVLSAERVA